MLQKNNKLQKISFLGGKPREKAKKTMPNSQAVVYGLHRVMFMRRQPMRRLLLASVAIAAITTAQSAAAADMVPVYKAQPAAAALPANWTGFYAGAHLGYGWGEKGIVDPFIFKNPIDAHGDVDGILGGLQLGYNHQINQFVLGIEGDFSWADVSGSFTCSAAGTVCTIKADWFATLTGRAGWTVDRALLYVKGGAAWAHDKITTTTPLSGSHTMSGWIIGGGVEYAFNRNWSGKIEYNYMDFGTETVTLCTPCNPADLSQHIHAIKFGVNYRFDWGRPVAAKY
jgi:outer membrane immunogenic protein